MTLAEQIGLPPGASKQQMLFAAAAILKVPTLCTAEELKRAYKAAAFDAHPDRNNGDSTRWMRLIAAYQVLQEPFAVKQGSPALTDEALESIVAPLADNVVDFLNGRLKGWLKRKGVSEVQQQNLGAAYDELGADAKKLFRKLLDDRRAKNASGGQ